MDTLSLLASESANRINPVGSLTPFGLPTTYICLAGMSFHVWLIKIKTKIIKANKIHDNVAITRTIKHIILAFILFARFDSTFVFPGSHLAEAKCFCPSHNEDAYSV